MLLQLLMLLLLLPATNLVDHPIYHIYTGDKHYSTFACLSLTLRSCKTSFYFFFFRIVLIQMGQTHGSPNPELVLDCTQQ